jgi:hypothetical protein
LEEAGAEVLELVLQVNCLGNSDTVYGLGISVSMSI